MREFIRWCDVFVDSAGQHVIVAACFNHGGLSAEMPDGAAVHDAGDVAVVGAAVHSALEQCRFEKAFNYSAAKKSEWPAYRVSGVRSMRQFEQEWTRLQVRGANEYNVTWEVSGPEIGDHGLRLVAVVAPTFDPSKTGAAVLYVASESLRMSTRP